ncbi:hypothetical protein [Pseudomonas putida]|uniref:SinR family protein n=1 Tax=Pseudomonas putida TaxID=303 RepID=A0A2C5W7R9_PSEPU|nr:hypothetical protein [Pseudomonas putida]PHH40240.1 hypothetical protein CRX57_08655 [Pseudomonas putida]
MALYLVTYDLHKQRDYPRIIEAIQKAGESEELLESVWLVSSARGIVELKEHLMGFIDSDDSIAVLPLKVAAGFATENCPVEARRWLNKHLSVKKT